MSDWNIPKSFSFPTKNYLSENFAFPPSSPGLSAEPHFSRISGISDSESKPFDVGFSQSKPKTEPNRLLLALNWYIDEPDPIRSERDHLGLVTTRGAQKGFRFLFRTSGRRLWIPTKMSFFPLLRSKDMTAVTTKFIYKKNWSRRAK